MAYVPQLPEEEKNQFGRTQPTTPVPPQGGGSAGTGTNAAPGQATSTQFGSNSAKLSDYLNANKEQVSQYGQDIASDLSGRYGQAMGAIDQGFGDFNKQVGQGYTPMNQSTVDQAASNPAEFVKSPDNVSAFKSLYNDSYQGPSSFESTPIYQNLNDQVNKAVENAGLAGSTSGLTSYLNNNMGGANRTPGMQTLDTALLQKNPESAKAIADAAAPYKSMPSYLSDKAAAGNQNVASAKQAALAAQKATQDRFLGDNGANKAFLTEANQKLSDLRGKEAGEAQQQRDFLGGGYAKNPFYGQGGDPYNGAQWVNSGGGPNMTGISADQFNSMAKDMGLTPDQLSEVMTNRSMAAQGYGAGPAAQGYIAPQDVNLLDYFQELPGSGLTYGNALGQGDYDRANALAMLSGDQSVVPSGSPIADGSNRSTFNYDNAMSVLGPLVSPIATQRAKDAQTAEQMRQNVGAPGSPSNPIFRPSPVETGAPLPPQPPTSGPGLGGINYPGLIGTNPIFTPTDPAPAVNTPVAPSPMTPPTLTPTPEEQTQPAFRLGNSKYPGVF